MLTLQVQGFLTKVVTSDTIITNHNALHNTFILSVFPNSTHQLSWKLEVCDRRLEGNHSTVYMGVRIIMHYL